MAKNEQITSDFVIVQPDNGQTPALPNASVNDVNIVSVSESKVTGTTAGSVVFIGSNLKQTEDNASLFWDDTNNRLGIGTATPAQMLDIVNPSAAPTLRMQTSGAFIPALNLDGNRVAGGQTIGQVNYIWNGTTVAALAGFTGNTSGSTKDDGYLSFRTRVTGGTVTEKMRVDQVGNVGINGSPNAPFHVLPITYAQGTMSNAASGTAVTGVGTQFLTDFHIGDTITANAETQTVTVVTSDTSMTTSAWTGANSGVPFTRGNAAGTNFYVFPAGSIQIGGSRTNVTNTGSTASSIVQSAASGAATVSPTPSFNIVVYNGNAGTTTGSSTLNFYRARGTEASPSAVLTGDRLAIMTGRGWDSSAFQIGPSAEMFTTENWDASHRGCKIVFSTVANTTIARTSALVIDQDQTAAVASRLAVGTGAAQPNWSLYVAGTNLTISTQVGIGNDTTFTAAGTTEFQSFRSSPHTAAGAYSVSNGYHYYVLDTGLGAGSSLNSQYGLYVSTLAAAAANYGVYVVSNQSFFGGVVGIGIQPNAAYPLQVKRASGASFIAAHDASNETGAGLWCLGSASTKNWLISSNVLAGGNFELIQSTANGGATAAATATFLIDGSGKITSNAATNNVVNLKSLSGAGAEQSIQFINAAASGSKNFLIGHTHALSNAFEITPSTANDGTSFTTPQFVVHGNGNTGVNTGTSAPGATLHVTGTNETIRLDGTTPYFRAILNATDNFFGSSSALVVGGTSTDLAIRAQNNLAFAIGTARKMFLTSGGNLLLDAGGFTVTQTNNTPSQSNLFAFNGSSTAGVFNGDLTGGMSTGSNGAASMMRVNMATSTSRSINAAGTINASAADYAEYMFKDVTEDIIAPGEVCGVKANAKLTKKWSEAIRFVVKSTSPAYVGGDIWAPTELEGESREDYMVRHEIERVKVDRIAFCGQVPCIVTGDFDAGDWIVAQEGDDDSIEAVAIADASITFAQHRKALGQVWKVQDDEKALVVVKL